MCFIFVFKLLCWLFFFLSINFQRINVRDARWKSCKLSCIAARLKVELECGQFIINVNIKRAMETRCSGLELLYVERQTSEYKRTRVAPLFCERFKEKVGI
jgi:hypothetical protein